MGDRNNPIKFGPEWLRNLARESSARTPDGSESPSAAAAANSPTSSGATAGAIGGNTVMASVHTPNTTNTTSNNNNNSSKVQLAKLRYGREEMLALYDRTTDAPPEIKLIDVLYQPRGKPPIALQNTFEDDMRESLRSGTASGGHPIDRFGVGRGGMGRAVSADRGRSRVPFVRQASAGRATTWHSGSPKMPGFNTGPDDDTSNIRPWMNSNGGSAANRNSGEQADWTQSKPFRNKRHGQATNWRQSREEGEEWRTADSHQRPRTNQQDKWGERDWGDRNPDKSQWNRRTWVGGDAQNEENLPEWAVENAEACGGTFDSSGAFHGYSNDDTNLPKNQEISYPLARSHTHGSFARSKTAEEGSEEWWASEKAKKLSPKRFDADVKFKKMNLPEGNIETGTDSKASTSKETPNTEAVTSGEATENATGGVSDDEKFSKNNSFKSQFPCESKAFDALLRADMSLEETTEEKGNFQSVMIPPSNSLRQKHQNLVAVAPEVFRESRDQRMLHLLNPQNSIENEARRIQASEDKIVEELFELTFNEKDPLSKQQKTIPSPHDQSNPNIATISPMVSNIPQLQSSGMQLRLSSPIFPNQGLLNPPQGLPIGIQLPMGGLPASLQQMPGMPPLGMPGGLPPSQMQPSGNQSSMQAQSLQEQLHNLQQSSGIPTSIQGGLPGNNGMQGQGLQGSMPPSMQTVGITNSALNASLGLPIGPVNNAIGIPMPNVPPNVLQNPGMNSGIGGPGMPGALSGAPIQGNPGMSGFPGNVGNNNSLFLGQNTNSPSMPADIPLPNQNNIFPIHGLQHSGSAAAFNSSLYSNIMPQSTPPPPPNPQSLSEQWYYQDPEKNIQGPFSSKDMYNWYRAGFFSPSLMVRRACDTHMRPLGSYGPVVPFTQMDMLPFPLTSGFDRSPGAHDPMINPQQALGLESVINVTFNEFTDAPIMNSIQFGSVGIIPLPPQQQMVDSLWGQPAPSAEMMWIQPPMNPRNDTRVNNLPMFFWDQKPSAISSNALLPEEITKEMKTEDQILAQLRATQNISTPQNISFMSEPPASSSPEKPEEVFSSTPKTTADLEELQKLIQKDTLTALPASEAVADDNEQQLPSAKMKIEQVPELKVLVNKVTGDSKPTKQNKNESEKAAKNKDNGNAKNKNKKKDEKKEDVECKTKEEVTKVEKRSEESSPTKNKKEEKLNKKELEKEKKEWLKEGFTIVKGPEKNTTKDNKKKMEEVKMAEDAEKKRKEEERLAAEEEKKKKQAETIKKQQELQQQHHQRQAAESVAKKAPWSAVSNQAMMATNKDGLTLAEIQRLEKEKKLEQMKEQQQMMQIIAQQQAAALAREQEMQAGLGWAKKKGTNINAASQTLAEIQAETRKQAVAAAAAMAMTALPSHEEIAAVINQVPWNSSPNGGFWDSPPNQSSKSEKGQESPKSAVGEQKSKRKTTVSSPVKKRADTSPAAEFDAWCTTVLATWSSKIDVTTFVGFLKDIESPYEVKDYVKYYLGESKDTNDFARQFLERRSKLLRVGMVTPSDDLCSPAMAVNPRTTSGSDYQEVKGKGKKTKKNKMLKVDARILGFSVTASEDRINVGDIDTV